MTDIDDDNGTLPLETGGASMVATTRVTIDAVNVIKGTLTDDTLVVRLPGGKHGTDSYQQWEGTPRFASGDHVVVFATEEGSPALANLTAFSNGAIFRRG